MVGTFDKKPDNFIQKAAEETKANSTDWFSKEHDRESILIYGHPKSGKTWSYCSIIKDVVDKANNVFILSTDGGLFRTFRLFFGDKWEEYAKKIKYYDIAGVNDGVGALKDIQSQVKKDDWIIIDLISDFWQMAQDNFVDKASNNNPEQYIIKAQSDMKKFGLLESSKWLYCKKLDNSVTQAIFYKFKCNILGITSAKDIEAGEKISGKMSPDNNIFRDIMYRPAGQKELSYRFNTVVYVSGEKKKYFRVVGDRGFVINSEYNYFVKDFWEKLKLSREVKEETK